MPFVHRSIYQIEDRLPGAGIDEIPSLGRLVIENENPIERDVALFCRFDGSLFKFCRAEEKFCAAVFGLPYKFANGESCAGTRVCASCAHG